MLIEETDVLMLARAGSAKAMGQLWRDHHRAGVLYARTLLSNTHDAEDLVSEAFMKVLAQFRRGAGPVQAFRSYLRMTIRNTAIDNARKAKELPHSPEWFFELPHISNTERVVEARMDLELASEALLALGARAREIFIRVDLMGDSIRGIAEELGCSANSVSASLYRTRMHLHRRVYAELREANEKVSHLASS